MRDFTMNEYRILCRQFSMFGYQVTTFIDYISSNVSKRIVVIRHDVDTCPENALVMAFMERDLGLKTTYYFRSEAPSYDEDIIRRIAMMGHEVGYHYEDLSHANGDFDKAIISFKENISKLRRICSVQTICMHGSPLSRWDNLQLWQHYDYHAFDVVGEPYLDIKFDEVLYLTDTGRSWKTANDNIRDQVESGFDYNFRHTSDIIRALENNTLPDKIMFNIHPQRWHDKYMPWLKELVWQNTKNIGKRILATRRQTMRLIT